MPTEILLNSITMNDLDKYYHLNDILSTDCF